MSSPPIRSRPTFKYGEVLVPRLRESRRRFFVTGYGEHGKRGAKQVHCIDENGFPFWCRVALIKRERPRQ